MDKVIEISQSRKESDISAVFDIALQLFGQEECWSREEDVSLILKYPWSQTVLRVDGQIVGYYDYFALTPKGLEAILSGDGENGGNADWFCDKATGVPLYLAGIAVLPHMRQYSCYLLQHLAQTMAAEGMHSPIYATAVSDDGKRVMSRMGFVCDEQHGDRVWFRLATNIKQP